MFRRVVVPNYTNSAFGVHLNYCTQRWAWPHFYAHRFGPLPPHRDISVPLRSFPRFPRSTYACSFSHTVSLAACSTLIVHHSRDQSAVPITICLYVPLWRCFSKSTLSKTSLLNIAAANLLHLTAFYNYGVAIPAWSGIPNIHRSFPFILNKRSGKRS